MKMDMAIPPKYRHVSKDQSIYKENDGYFKTATRQNNLK